MDEPTGGEIRRGDGFTIAPTSTTPQLAEELCRRLRIDEGRARLELDFMNGYLELIRRHDRVTLKRLAEQFDGS